MDSGLHSVYNEEPFGVQVELTGLSVRAHMSVLFRYGFVLGFYVGVRAYQAGALSCGLSPLASFTFFYKHWGRTQDVEHTEQKHRSTLLSEILYLHLQACTCVYRRLLHVS